MRLEEWMRQNRVTQAEFGARVGVGQDAVSRWASGSRTPRPDHMAQIRRETGGAVTADDFIGDLDDEDSVRATASPSPRAA